MLRLNQTKGYAAGGRLPRLCVGNLGIDAFGPLRSIEDASCCAEGFREAAVQSIMGLARSASGHLKCGPQAGLRLHLTLISNDAGSGRGIAAVKFIERLFDSLVGPLKKHDAALSGGMAIAVTRAMTAKT